MNYNNHSKITEFVNSVCIWINQTNCLFHKWQIGWTLLNCSSVTWWKMFQCHGYCILILHAYFQNILYILLFFVAYRMKHWMLLYSQRYWMIVISIFVKNVTKNVMPIRYMYNNICKEGVYNSICRCWG